MTRGVTMDQVAAWASDLPEVQEGERYGHRTWAVGKKAFAWDRPFSKADIKRFGDAPVPEGPILAVTVADLSEKEAVLASGDPGFFTISHFDGYAAVLIELGAARPEHVQEALVDGWLACAPEPLAEAYARDHDLG